MKELDEALMVTVIRTPQENISGVRRVRITDIMDDNTGQTIILGKHDMDALGGADADGDKVSIALDKDLPDGMKKMFDSYQDWSRYNPDEEIKEISKSNPLLNGPESIFDVNAVMTSIIGNINAGASLGKVAGSAKFMSILKAGEAKYAKDWKAPKIDKNSIFKTNPNGKKIHLEFDDSEKAWFNKANPEELEMYFTRVFGDIATKDVEVFITPKIGAMESFISAMTKFKASIGDNFKMKISIALPKTMKSYKRHTVKATDADGNKYDRKVAPSKGSLDAAQRLAESTGGNKELVFNGKDDMEKNVGNVTDEYVQMGFKEKGTNLEDITIDKYIQRTGNIGFTLPDREVIDDVFKFYIRMSADAGKYGGMPPFESVEGDIYSKLFNNNKAIGDRVEGTIFKNFVNEMGIQQDLRKAIKAVTTGYGKRKVIDYKGNEVEKDVRLRPDEIYELVERVTEADGKPATGLVAALHKLPRVSGGVVDKIDADAMLRTLEATTVHKDNPVGLKRSYDMVKYLHEVGAKDDFSVTGVAEQIAQNKNKVVELLKLIPKDFGMKDRLEAIAFSETVGKTDKIVIASALTELKEFTNNALLQDIWKASANEMINYFNEKATKERPFGSGISLVEIEKWAKGKGTPRKDIGAKAVEGLVTIKSIWKTTTTLINDFKELSAKARKGGSGKIDAVDLQELQKRILLNAPEDPFFNEYYYYKFMDTIHGENNSLKGDGRAAASRIIEILPVIPEHLSKMLGERGQDMLNKMKGESRAAKEPKPIDAKKINVYYGSGESKEFSNLANRPFTVDLYELGDVKFNTLEGAFQALKTAYTTEYDKSHTEILEKLQTASGAEAKRLGRKIKNLDVNKWDSVAYDEMKRLMLKSFEQNPDTMKKLIATGNAEFTHTQDKSKWGKLFPKALMEVRNELAKKHGDTSTYLVNGIPHQLTEQERAAAGIPFMNPMLNVPHMLKLFGVWKTKADKDAKFVNTVGQFLDNYNKHNPLLRTIEGVNDDPYSVFEALTGTSIAKLDEQGVLERINNMSRKQKQAFYDYAFTFAQGKTMFKRISDSKFKGLWKKYYENKLPAAVFEKFGAGKKLAYDLMTKISYVERMKNQWGNVLGVIDSDFQELVDKGWKEEDLHHELAKALYTKEGREKAPQDIKNIVSKITSSEQFGGEDALQALWHMGADTREMLADNMMMTLNHKMKNATNYEKANFLGMSLEDYENQTTIEEKKELMTRAMVGIRKSLDKEPGHYQYYYPLRHKEAKMDMYAQQTAILEQLKNEDMKAKDIETEIVYSYESGHMKERMEHAKLPEKVNVFEDFKHYYNSIINAYQHNAMLKAYSEYYDSVNEMFKDGSIHEHADAVEWVNDFVAENAKHSFGGSNKHTAWDNSMNAVSAAIFGSTIAGSLSSSVHNAAQRLVPALLAGSDVWREAGAWVKGDRELSINGHSLAKWSNIQREMGIEAFTQTSRFADQAYEDLISEQRKEYELVQKNALAKDTIDRAGRRLKDGEINQKTFDEIEALQNKVIETIEKEINSPNYSKKVMEIMQKWAGAVSEGKIGKYEAPAVIRQMLFKEIEKGNRMYAGRIGYYQSYKAKAKELERNRGVFEPDATEEWTTRREHNRVLEEQGTDPKDLPEIPSIDKLIADKMHKKAHEAGLNGARNMIALTQFDYHGWNTPKFLRTPSQKAFFQFKGFLAHQINLFDKQRQSLVKHQATGLYKEQAMGATRLFAAAGALRMMGAVAALGGLDQFIPVPFADELTDLVKVFMGDPDAFYGKGATGVPFMFAGAGASMAYDAVVNAYGATQGGARDVAYVNKKFGAVGKLFHDKPFDTRYIMPQYGYRYLSSANRLLALPVEAYSNKRLSGNMGQEVINTTLKEVLGIYKEFKQK